MQVGNGMVTSCQFRWQLVTPTFHQLPVTITRKVDDLTLFQQGLQVAQDGHVDRMSAFAASEHQYHRKLAGNTKVLMCCLTVPERQVWSDRVARFIHSFVKVLLRLLSGHRNDVHKSSDGLDCHTRLDIRHVENGGNRASSKCHGCCHITTGKE